MKEHHGTKCGQYIHYQNFRPIEIITADEENGFFEIAESAFAHSNLQRIVISDFVAIRDWAFQSCSELSQVMFSPDLLKIGEGAFSDCTKLTQIILPEELISIGRRAFKDCTSLKEVIIYGKLEYIEDEAFMGCTALERIVVPKSVKKIGNYAFSGCTSLYEVDFQEREVSWAGSDKGILQMGKAPFFGCDSVKFFGYTPYVCKTDRAGQVVKYQKIPKKLFENAMFGDENPLLKVLCKSSKSKVFSESAEDFKNGEYSEMQDFTESESVQHTEMYDFESLKIFNIY